MKDGESDRETECGGFTTTSSGSEGNGLREGFRSDRVSESEDGFRLIECSGFGDNLSDSFRILEGLL